MKNFVKLSVSGFLLFLALTPAVMADQFQGEIVSVDQTQGTVGVRYRNRNGQIMGEQTFRIQPGRTLATAGTQTLQDVEVGDMIEVNAFSRNGAWEVQSLVTTPANPNAPSVLVAGPTLPGQAPSTTLAPATGATRSTFPSTTTVTTNNNNPFAVSGTTTQTTANSPFTSGTPNIFSSQGTTSTTTAATGPTFSNSSGNLGGTNGAQGTPGRNAAEGTPSPSGVSSVTSNSQGGTR